MRSRAIFRDVFPPSDGIPGKHKEANMLARISGGRDEMGWRAFRRSFSAPNNLMDSSIALISSSMRCDSLERAWVEFIKTEIVG